MGGNGSRPTRIPGIWAVGALELLVVFSLIGLAPGPALAGPLDRPRLVVMTDIGGDPDDKQSLVRFLVMVNEFDLEGLCTGFGHGHYSQTQPEMIHQAIDAYGAVWPSLKRHDAAYPAPDALHALVKDGHNGDPHTVGAGMDSAASDWIIEILKRDDPRPIWFTVWGGPRELAQALWRLDQTHDAAAMKEIEEKIRVHSIADQDKTAGWVKEHHPSVFWISSLLQFRGIWKEGDQRPVSPEWLEANVRSGHGPLGAWYPPKAAGKDGVKEGDSPSFLYVLSHGLSDPEQPSWGNWGGRFGPTGSGHSFEPVPDLRDGKEDLLYPIQRWRAAYQNDFAARMDRCVKPPAEVNHVPVAVLNGDETLQVVRESAQPGERIRLDAADSHDAERDELSCHWWVYQEAGTYASRVSIRGSDQPQAELRFPEDGGGASIHVVLEVTDDGDPPLTAYRRLIVEGSQRGDH